VVAELRVLLVEDDAMNVKFFQRAAARHERSVIDVANSGREAIELARGGGYVAVFLDLHLPDLDGREVLAQMRSDGSLDSTPVIISTADSSLATQRELQDLGVDGFLIKPIDLGALDQLLEHLRPEPTD